MAIYLRHKRKGTIYSYNQYLAEHPDVVEVTEEEAFPERFAPKEAKGRKAKVDLSTVVPEPPTGNSDLNEELTKATGA